MKNVYRFLALSEIYWFKDLALPIFVTMIGFTMVGLTLRAVPRFLITVTRPEA
ncbi:hypothetical protein G8759_26975 [Spirosoma aureum]|uniref:Uncharacterized protein n=1 Tax=Spirosoma aureum TaxID=2692134 RepID=A0A6G9AUL6_9BACT|nr:hypothetical protein [Spirosoma aureum]QIP16019.1 hypothetical protein G8759_26975 [Spirosoma aureum]